VDVGAVATFTCHSTMPNGISWHFTPLDGSSQLLFDAMVMLSGANISIFYNQTTETKSIIVLQGVGKQDTGTIECADDREKAFADLTVLGELVYFRNAVI